MKKSLITLLFFSFMAALPVHSTEIPTSGEMFLDFPVSSSSVNNPVVPVAMPLPAMLKESDEISETVKQVEPVKTPDKLDYIAELRTQAKFLYNANQYEKSVQVYNQISDVDKISEDWVILANISQDLKKDIDAVFFLKKAIQADEKNYKAHYNLANMYLADNKPNAAIDEYNKAIKIKKDFSYAYFNKGCALLTQEKYKQAKFQFGLAIKNNSAEPAFYYNLAYTYKMLNKTQKAKEALEMYEKVMAN